MGERLTIEELRARYDGEWVALVDVEVDENDEVLNGHVLAHDADGDALYEKIGLEESRMVTIDCFRQIPAGWGLAL